MFHQLLRAAQLRKSNLVVVGSVNYIVAALIGAALFLLRADGHTHVSMTAGVLGLINGVLFAAHLVLIFWSFRVAGVGIASAVIQCAVVVPVVISWFFWEEVMSPLRWVAVALLPLAIVLMRPPQKNRWKLTVGADIVLLLAFAGSACIFTLHRAQRQYTAQDGAFYQMCLFAAAAVSCTIIMLVRRDRLAPSDVRHGLSIGLVNGMYLAFLLLALVKMPSVILYPLTSASVIVLNLGLSRLLWEERVSHRQIAGVIVALAIVILVGM